MTALPDNPLECKKCDLYRTRLNVVMPTPCDPGGLLAIGEAPGADEDMTGRGFVGDSGQRLDELLRAIGFTRGWEYGVANIIRCRPPGNRKPKKPEIKACIALLADAIVQIQPRVLLLVGDTAARAFLGHKSLEAKVEASRKNPRCDFTSADPSLVNRLQQISPSLLSEGILAIPMPHTSGLSWNVRTRKSHERWSIIGNQQIRLACALASGKAIEALETDKAPEQGTLEF